MRSLWRTIAARWLGGHGSEALTRDSALLDLLMITEAERTAPVFRVSRQSEISHRAIMSRHDDGGAKAAGALAAALPDETKG